MTRRRPLGVSLIAILCALPALAAPAEWPDDAWVAPHAAPDGGVRLAVSSDGQQWRDLDRIVLKPAAGDGSLREPQLSRGPDGLFRLVWATAGKDPHIGYASSADLRNWSAQTAIPLAGNSGAVSEPEIAYDAADKRYVISWKSGASRRIVQLATADFKTFTRRPAQSGAQTGAKAGASGDAPAQLARRGKPLWVAPWLVKELEAATPASAPATPVPAPPPALEGYTADPSIRVFGDTYYLYPTSDKPHWQTTDFSVWSSKNLVAWKKERMVLDVVHDLKWGNIEAWAPDAIERNGAYYFYFCAHGEIGVATASTPLGPFADALGKPLLRKGSGINTNTIDPYPFIDDDGQAYLYYGNGKYANVYKLKPDMVTLDGPPAVIALKEFREGIVVFKRGGKYYFMWSIDDARSPNYRVGWGVADSPTGPVTSPDDNFIVLQRHGAVVGTAHHSVVNVPGTDRWYVAYHRHALPEGGGYQRQTVLARMAFDQAGNIQPIDPLLAPFKPGDTGEPIVNGKGLATP